MKLHLVSDPGEAARIAGALRSEGVLGLDTETDLAMSVNGGADGMPTHPADPRMQPTLVQVATDTDAFVFDMTLVQPLRPQIDHDHRARMVGALEALLWDPAPRFVLHNAAFDLHVLANAARRYLGREATPAGVLCDTLTAEHLLRSDDWTLAGERADRTLKGLCSARFNEDLPDYADLFTAQTKGKGGGKKYVMGAWEVLRTFGGRDALIPYAAKDPWLTVRLYRALRAELDGAEWTRKAGGALWDLYVATERDLLHALVAAEREGAPIDQPRLRALGAKAEAQEARAAAKWVDEIQALGIDRRLGRMPSISSNQDLCQVFGALDLVAPDYKLDPKRVEDPDFDRALLDHIEVFGEDVPTVKSAGVVDAETLKHWGHPLADVVLSHREASKTRGTYCVPIDRMVELMGDGRLRASFKQAATRTNRLASKSPNAQNISAKGLGAELRDCFYAPEGFDVGAIDQAAIEARLAAVVSRDPALLQIFRDDLDPHSRTAQLIFSECRGLSLEEIAQRLPKFRKMGKIVNYLSLFGGGPKKLAWFAGIPFDVAKRVVREYWAAYATLARYKERLTERASAEGVVYTIMRRPIQLTGVFSQDPAIRSRAERQALNSTIQGSSADILKTAMILIHQDADLRRDDVRMVLTVHDELVFWAPKGALAKHKARIDDYVSRPLEIRYGYRLPIPTPAALDIGRTWGEAKSPPKPVPEAKAA